MPQKINNSAQVAAVCYSPVNEKAEEIHAQRKSGIAFRLNVR